METKKQAYAVTYELPRSCAIEGVPFDTLEDAREQYVNELEMKVPGTVVRLVETLDTYDEDGECVESVEIREIAKAVVE